MPDPAHSVPPPSGAPPQPAAETPSGVDVELKLEPGSSPSALDGLLRLESRRVTIEHAPSLRAPLRIALGLVKLAAVDSGPANVSRQVGRFAILRRLSATTVIPSEEGIEGWLWTSTGGTALTSLVDGDDAPNVALVFTKPLDDAVLRGAFEPDFVTALAARSPLGNPAVAGLVLRVKDATAARNAFRRWGFQAIVTDRDIAPVQRRHLPTDRPADPMVRARGADAARARTSVAPPGFG